MITLNNLGGRTIHLFLPFEFNGKKIDTVTLAPLRFGHVLGWNEGKWKTSIGLLSEMSGLEEHIIREIRYPDADRVFEAFLGMLTPTLREDIETGRVPPPVVVEKPAAEATNGSGQPMQGPGVPIPPEMMQPGFDLSEEEQP